MKKYAIWFIFLLVLKVAASGIATSKRESDKSAPGIIDDSKKQDKKAESRRYVFKPGGFSFVPPKEWKEYNIPGFKFKAFIAPVETGFSSNMNVVDEPYTGNLDKYVADTKTALQKEFKKFKLIKEDTFKTDADLEVARLVTESEHKDLLMRQTFYIVPAPKMMLVVTCTTSVEDGEELDGTFKASMKTFRLEPAKKKAPD